MVNEGAVFLFLMMCRRMNVYNIDYCDYYNRVVCIEIVRFLHVRTSKSKSYYMYISYEENVRKNICTRRPSLT